MNNRRPRYPLQPASGKGSLTRAGFVSGGRSVSENNEKTVSNLKPFKPGQSGNPGGRPKGIARLAREHTDRALEVLAEALDDDDKRVAVAAAKELLDRGWGKAVTMTADVSKRLDEFDDDTLDAAIDALRAAIGSPAEAGDGAGAETQH